MKRMMILLVVSMLTAFVCSPALADSHKSGGKAGKMMVEGIETFVEGCEAELTTYCKDVTPGEGRLLACLYAHQDKVSPKCEYALIDAAIQLDRAISALTYFANVCEADLEKHCLDVEIGEGRVIDCLSKQKDNLAPECRESLEDMK